MNRAKMKRPRHLPEHESHLSAFIDGFISSDRRRRAFHVLIERPGKFRAESHRFDSWLDLANCRRLLGEEYCRALRDERWSALSGVCLDDRAECSVATLPEAAARYAREHRDLLLSLIPGRLGFFFHHHGAIYLCSR